MENKTYYETLKEFGNTKKEITPDQLLEIANKIAIEKADFNAKNEKLLGVTVHTEDKDFFWWAQFKGFVSAVESELFKEEEEK